MAISTTVKALPRIVYQALGGLRFNGDIIELPVVITATNIVERNPNYYRVEYSISSEGAITNGAGIVEVPAGSYGSDDDILLAAEHIAKEDVSWL